jgi:hypothetical protein
MILYTKLVVRVESAQVAVELCKLDTNGGVLLEPGKKLIVQLLASLRHGEEAIARA